MAFLFGVAAPFSAVNSLYHRLVDECRAVVVAFLLYKFKVELYLVLLAPLYQLALEVHFLVRHLVEVDKLRQDAFLHEAHARAVAAVQVDGPYEGFERISFHIAVMRGHVSVGYYELAYAYFVCQAVERLALYDFASCRGKESFALAFEVTENYVAHDGVEYCVAKELKAFVVYGFTLCVALGHAAVHERLLVEVDVVRVKSDDVA